jgi:hypothetical protein
MGTFLGETEQPIPVGRSRNMPRFRQLFSKALHVHAAPPERITAHTRSTSSVSLDGVSVPAVRKMTASWTVTSRCGRATLGRSIPPRMKSAGLMVTAAECDSDRLVIWQISRSPRANVASTTAGRRLLACRAVNGNGTTTTSPLTNSATPHPLQVYPNPPPKRTLRAAAGHARPRSRHCQRRGPEGAVETRAPPAARSRGRVRVPRSEISSAATCLQG